MTDRGEFLARIRKDTKRRQGTESSTQEDDSTKLAEHRRKMRQDIEGMQIKQIDDMIRGHKSEMRALKKRQNEHLNSELQKIEKKYEPRLKEINDNYDTQQENSLQRGRNELDELDESHSDYQKGYDIITEAYRTKYTNIRIDREKAIDSFYRQVNGEKSFVKKSLQDEHEKALSELSSQHEEALKALKEQRFKDLKESALNFKNTLDALRKEDLAKNAEIEKKKTKINADLNEVNTIIQWFVESAKESYNQNSQIEKILKGREERVKQIEAIRRMHDNMIFFMRSPANTEMWDQYAKISQGLVEEAKSIRQKEIESTDGHTKDHARSTQRDLATSDNSVEIKRQRFKEKTEEEMEEIQKKSEETIKNIEEELRKFDEVTSNGTKTRKGMNLRIFKEQRMEQRKEMQKSLEKHKENIARKLENMQKEIEKFQDGRGQGRGNPKRKKGKNREGGDSGPKEYPEE